MTDDRAPARLQDDPLELPPELPLSKEEAGYVAAARAPNTLRGYRSDWSEFTTWCTHAKLDPLPAAAATISSYLTELARAGAKVGTMSRRLSAIRFAHQLRDLPDPTTGARVVAVWEGIRRTHGAPPDQAAPLMPPELLDVLAACPSTKTWKTRGRAAERDLAGLRDRALLLVGFFAALRRVELAGLTVDQVTDHPNGLVLSLPRSKTNCRPGSRPPASRTVRCCVRSARAIGRSPGRCTRSRSTISCRPPWLAPASTPRRTARTPCAPALSPTPICAALPTGPSPTRHATVRSPPSAPTSASTRSGPRTPQPNSDCNVL